MSGRNGPVSINAAAAYRVGATWRGITIGVVDSGIDTSQVEFAGRISPLSRDFAGNENVEDPEGHGTAVAGVLAAANNDRNTLGVAFDSTILALRTDRPGSCAETGDDGGCKHPDPAIGGGDRLCPAERGARHQRLAGRWGHRVRRARRHRPGHRAGDHRGDLRRQRRRRDQGHEPRPLPPRSPAIPRPAAW